MSVSIIAREEEFRILNAFLDAAPPASAALVLEGEAGIGKSTLWSAGVTAARERGMRVLSARPAEAERELAYAGLGDLLEGVLDDVRPALTPPRRRALAVALAIEDSAEGFDARTLAVAVRTALDALAEDGPVLLAVDDAQWLDPPSAAALTFALRRLHERPIQLLLTRRIGGTREPSGLEASIPPERVGRLRVGPLSLGSIQALLRARLDRTFGRLGLIRIHETSGGNAFYALELARALPLDIDPTQPLPLPGTLEDLVRARLNGFPDATREALMLVSAVGSPSDALLRAAGVAEEALEPALAAHVIERDPEHGVTHVTHPLLASVLYQGMSRQELRRVHGLLALIVDDPVARARHLALASEGPDAEIAAALENAAAMAEGHGASTVAADLVELALRLTPPDDHEPRHRRTIAAAHMQLIAGDVRGARQRADDLLSRTPEGPTRAEALVLLSSVENVTGSLERAVSLRREALPDAYPALRAAIHQWLGANVRHAEGIRAGTLHARASLELAEDIGDEALRAGALAILATLRFEAGEPDALALAEEAYTVSTALAKSAPATNLSLAHLLSWLVNRLDLLATFCLANILVDTGRFDRARALLDSLLREVGARDELAAGQVLWMLSMLELQAGRWDLATDYVDRAREISLQYRPEREDPGHLLVVAELAVHRGDLERARVLAERGGEFAQEQRDFLAPLEGILGLADRLSGDPAAAVERFAAAERLARDDGWGEPVMYSWRGDFVEALLELGRVDDAGGLLDAWERDARRLGREWVLAQVTRCRGLVAAARGDVDGALSILEVAAAQHEAIGDHFGRARALLALGVARRRARQKRAAYEAIEESLAGFEQLGAATWTERARGERARIGGRTRAVGLSPAERRVALLVAEGRTNREVAAALVLGERTVETHLTHIYAKLGVRSRTELARTLSPP